MKFWIICAFENKYLGEGHSVCSGRPSSGLGLHHERLKILLFPAQNDKELVFTRSDDSGPQRAFHGLARALAANAVQGVSQGFTKELDIVGVGFRAETKGQSVIFTLGFSHPIEYPIPAGVEVKVDKQTRLTVSGVDRQQVGQVAAVIRSLRKPDPYKNKGIRYVGEVLKKKAGKTGGAAA